MSDRRMSCFAVLAVLTCVWATGLGSSAFAADATVNVNYSSVVRTIPSDFHGVNYVAFWDDNQGSTGSRNALQRAGVKLIRFPGGAPADWHDWDKPTTWTTTSTLDLRDYANAVGAAIMLQTNPTSNTVNDQGTINDSSGTHAADWVSYCINNNVNVPYWEVGNEPDLHMVNANDYGHLQWYFDKFNEQAPAMKARSSSIQVAGPVGTNAWQWWGLNSLGMFIDQCDHNADAISLHWYTWGTTWDGMKGQAQNWQSNMDFIRSKTSKPIWITEWNVAGGQDNSTMTWACTALANADIIGAYAKSGVTRHCFFGNIHQVNQNWGILASGTDYRPLDSAGPSYFVLPLWSAMGTQVLNVTNTADAASRLSVWSHKKSDGSVQVMLVNKGAAMSVDVAFTGFDPSGRTVSIYELRSSNGSATSLDVYYNGSLNPSPATSNLPAPSTTTSSGSVFTRNLPAMSVTVLDFGGGTSSSQGTFGNNGNAWSISSSGTTRIQAENFDTGGQGIAYSDADTVNSGAAYRTSEGVDIQSTTDTGGGYNVGWVSAGEWLEYTVNVASAGTYDLKLRVARQPTGSSTVRVLFNGTDKTGSMSVPSTGGWQTWTTITKTGVSLSAGQQVMRIDLTGTSYNVNWIELTAASTPPPAAPTNLTATAGNGQVALSWNASSGATSYNVKRSTTSGSGYSTIASPTTTSYTNTGLTNGVTYYYVVTAVNSGGESGNSNQASATPTAPPSGDGSPYGGTARAIPGTIQSEDYNTGGQGVAYSDTDATNNGGAYRTSEAVDVETCSEGGHDVGWTANTEYLKYTVNVGTAGTYNINIRHAGTANGTLRIEFGGVDKTGTVTLNSTGGWQTWATTTISGVSLSAGQQVMRVVLLSGGYNLNFISVTTPTAPSLYIYNDSLAGDWANWSWNTTVNFSNTSPVRVGSNSISATYTAGWAALSLRKGTAISTSGYSSVKFWVHGGSGSNKAVKFDTQTADGSGYSTPYTFTATAGTWTEITVPMSALGNPSTIKRINFQENSGSAQTAIYFDEIRLVP